MTGPKIIPRAEWLAEGERLFGTRDPRTWRFRCPSCGHVQTWAAWEALKHPDPARVLGYTCIGALRGGPGVVEVGQPDRGSGCRFAGAVDQIGLIPLFVQAGVAPKGGVELPVGELVFNFAPPRHRRVG